MAEPPTPAYLDLKAASVWCCLSTRTLRRAVEAGRLKAFKRGGKILIRARDLEAWLEENEYRGQVDLESLESIVAGVKAKYGRKRSEHQVID